MRLAEARGLQDGLGTIQGCCFSFPVLSVRSAIAFVCVVTAAEKGCGGLDISTRLKATDAMITDLPDIPLMILIADCVAIGLYDPRQNAIGIAHAGWRGTTAGIAQLTISKMMDIYGSDPEDMFASISPSIGPCCYQVGDRITRTLNIN